MAFECYGALFLVCFLCFIYLFIYFRFLPSLVYNSLMYVEKGESRILVFVFMGLLV